MIVCSWVPRLTVRRSSVGVAPVVLHTPLTRKAPSESAGTATDVSRKSGTVLKLSSSKASTSCCRSVVSLRSITCCALPATSAAMAEGSPRGTLETPPSCSAIQRSTPRLAFTPGFGEGTCMGKRRGERPVSCGTCLRLSRPSLSRSTASQRGPPSSEAAWSIRSSISVRSVPPPKRRARTAALASASVTRAARRVATRLNDQTEYCANLWPCSSYAAPSALRIASASSTIAGELLSDVSMKRPICGALDSPPECSAATGELASVDADALSAAVMCRLLRHALQ
mmetsp:Transcript_10795/g.24856  ORF Transcript_10795/g.24856 Transcript_10795/m.24856 type:complete len:284 (+) Transcript_10795:2089-2940(+)